MKERNYQEKPFSSFTDGLNELKRVFRGNYTTPWWGDKITSGMRGGGRIVNRGFVIGYRDDTLGMRWRLDYDPDPKKALHINFEQDLGRKNVDAVCFLLNSTRRVPGDEMWFWWVRWTTKHHEEIPQKIKDKLGDGVIWRNGYWA